jgi:hypothetical protein
MRLLNSSISHLQRAEIVTINWFRTRLSGMRRRIVNCKRHISKVAKRCGNLSARRLGPPGGRWKTVPGLLEERKFLKGRLNTIVGNTGTFKYPFEIVAPDRIRKWSMYLFQILQANFKDLCFHASPVFLKSHFISHNCPNVALLFLVGLFSEASFSSV